MTEILRYAAFTDDPAGGNPAGVVLDATGLDADVMQRIAADVGFSETAFLVPTAPGRFDVRYFSPLMEVPFCGHATIASAVAVGERVGPGLLTFETAAGTVPVEVSPDGSATLTSVTPRVAEAAPEDVREALAALRWRNDELDASLPPRVGYAGAYHLILAASTRERLADLDYDFDRLATLMTARDWVTLQLVWRESAEVFHVRNPFPVGGVVEDPATGAAAAALGGYLRAQDAVALPASLTLFQGYDLGRPSRLRVEIPVGTSGIRVSGHGVRL